MDLRTPTILVHSLTSHLLRRLQFVQTHFPDAHLPHSPSSHLLLKRLHFPRLTSLIQHYTFTTLSLVMAVGHEAARSAMAQQKHIFPSSLTHTFSPNPSLEASEECQTGVIEGWSWLGELQGLCFTPPAASTLGPERKHLGEGASASKSS